MMGQRLSMERIFRIPQPVKKVLLRLVVVMVAILILHVLEVVPLIMASYRIEYTNNFYEVKPGVLYRSGEMAPEQLRELIKRHGIASVLDLRISGETIRQAGTSEPQLAGSLGAAYVNFPLATTRVPPKEDLLRLEEVLHSLKTPLLIHCSTGALRTGVVTTLWLQEVAGLPPQEAKRQLSPYFGYSIVEYLYKEWSNKHPPLPYLLYKYWDDQAHGSGNQDFHSWLMAGKTGLDEGGKLTFRPAPAQDIERSGGAGL